MGGDGRAPGHERLAPAGSAGQVLAPGVQRRGIFSGTSTRSSDRLASARPPSSTTSGPATSPLSGYSPVSATYWSTASSSITSPRSASVIRFGWSASSACSRSSASASCISFLSTAILPGSACPPLPALMVSRPPAAQTQSLYDSAGSPCLGYPRQRVISVVDFPAPWPSLHRCKHAADHVIPVERRDQIHARKPRGADGAGGLGGDLDAEARPLGAVLARCLEPLDHSIRDGDPREAVDGARVVGREDRHHAREDRDTEIRRLLAEEGDSLLTVDRLRERDLRAGADLPHQPLHLGVEPFRPLPLPAAVVVERRRQEEL